MPVRIIVSKDCAAGESISVEVTQSNPVTGATMHTEQEMKAIMERAITIVDDRMVEMNMRMLESKDFQRFFDAQTWQRFRQILEVIYGRMSVETLAHRWQSEREETAELEAARAQAHQPGAASPDGTPGLHDSVPAGEQTVQPGQVGPTHGGRYV